MIRSTLKASRLIRWHSSAAYRLLYLEDTRALSRRQTLGLGLLLFTGTTISAYAFYRLQPTQRLYCDASANQRDVGYKARRTIEDILGENSQTYLPSKEAGFKRFDFAQAGSNEPVEDYHAELFMPKAPGDSSWSFFAILDGHAGYKTASWLSEHLLPSLARALRFNALKSSSTTIDSDSQDTIISQTFLALDNEIVNDALELAFSQSSIAMAHNILARATSGSCALVAFYDSASSKLKIANVGDSRAVLGRLTTSGDSGEKVYEVIPLSYDHNGLNPSEVSRLTALHPNEPDLFSADGSGRTIGWGCARAFGDGRTKWPLDAQERLRKEYLCGRPSKMVKTPPYFTAEPEIVSAEVKEGDFLIMASDGLWECLTNEEAVGLVGRWAQMRDSSSSERALGARKERQDELPVFSPPSSPSSSSSSSSSSGSSTTKETTPRYRQWNTPKKFTFTQARRESSAEHLLRNALGGMNEDLREALLNMRGSRARAFRDDISISVVFF